MIDERAVQIGKLTENAGGRLVQTVQIGKFVKNLIVDTVS